MPSVMKTPKERSHMNATAEALREKAAKHDQDARESFERCDTDGFLSQWASGINAQKARMEADIAEAGGVATFTRLDLFDLDGNPVAAKIIEGRYGLCHALLDDAGNFTGEFVGCQPARELTMTRKGYREELVEFVAPAKAKLVGEVTVYAQLAPADPTVNYYGSVGVGDLTGEES